MTQVLVSVQNLEELQLALQAGIQWIDLKDPQAGSLGAPSLPVLFQIAQFLSTLQYPLPKTDPLPSNSSPTQPLNHPRVTQPAIPTFSLAAGECEDWASHTFFPQAALLPFQFLKIALHGCRNHPHWLQQVTQLRGILPPEMGLILVHYADAARANAPSFHEVLEASRLLHASYLLIDTWKKDGLGLRHWLDDATLASHIATCHHHSIRISLAGSLSLHDLDELRLLAPDVLAVRGAACNQADRKSTLCPQRLAQLAHWSRQHVSNPVCLAKSPNAYSKVAHEESKI